MIRAADFKPVEVHVFPLPYIDTVEPAIFAQMHLLSMPEHKKALSLT